MKKLKNKRGVSLAEMLVVVAIIAILGGVIFIAVWNYQRSLGQLERDGVAKEIFVAAQNHLTPAYGEGYLGLKEPADSDDPKSFGIQADDGTYYFTVNNGHVVPSDADAIFEQMLPFGSVDETVRAGGSYIIHYQKETGLMLDVFYCTRNASPSQFNHVLGGGGENETTATVSGLESEYPAVIVLADDTKKSERRTYIYGEGGNKSILGWYGGTGAASLPKTTLDPPTINVVNAEKLYVEVSNPNTNVKDDAGNPVTYVIRLLVKGLSSDKEHYIDVTDFTEPIVLDDITSPSNHFGNRIFDDMESGQKNGFIPGENITIQAVAFSTSALTNVAYSNKVTTNSLFESTGNVLGSDDVLETAYIGNIRHLENLDAYVSNLGTQTTDNKHEQFSITAAKQTTSFSWKTFMERTEGDDTSISYSELKDDFYSIEKNTDTGSYYPISPDYALVYDGQSHSISDVAVNITEVIADDIGGHAGLFGAISEYTVSAISNLELIDFSITGTETAGALAGTLNGTRVTNVIARATDSKKALANQITAPTAGGLIGDMSGYMEYSAAAVIVNGSDVAGGLVGTASGSITGCYSGGHTTKGDYKTWIETKDADNKPPYGYDVTGATAGGLVGVYTGSKIENSYSTCSVSGSVSDTSTAGGFVGTASTAICSIENCYATGLVKASTITEENDHGTNNKVGAFAGSLSDTVTVTDCRYYSVINEIIRTETINGKETQTLDHYLGAIGDADKSGVTPLDRNEDSYNAFVGAFAAWDPARAYDSPLVQYYSGKYPLRTVLQLPVTAEAKAKTAPDPDDPDDPDDTKWQLFVATHYGDWPSPEVFFINE